MHHCEELAALARSSYEGVVDIFSRITRAKQQIIKRLWFLKDLPNMGNLEALPKPNHVTKRSLDLPVILPTVPMALVSPPISSIFS